MSFLLSLCDTGKRAPLALLFCVAAFLPASSCREQKEEPAGGGCSYRYTYHPIRLIRTDTVTWNQFGPRFVPVDTSGPYGKDTIYFENAGRHYLYRSELDSFDLRVGSIHRLEEMNITSGHCSPHLTRVLLEPKRK